MRKNTKQTCRPLFRNQQRLQSICAHRNQQRPTTINLRVTFFPFPPQAAHARVPRGTYMSRVSVASVNHLRERASVVIASGEWVGGGDVDRVHDVPNRCGHDHCVGYERVFFSSHKTGKTPCRLLIGSTTREPRGGGHLWQRRLDRRWGRRSRYYWGIRSVSFSIRLLHKASRSYPSYYVYLNQYKPTAAATRTFSNPQIRRRQSRDNPSRTPPVPIGQYYAPDPSETRCWPPQAVRPNSHARERNPRSSGHSKVPPSCPGMYNRTRSTHWNDLNIGDLRAVSPEPRSQRKECRGLPPIFQSPRPRWRIPPCKLLGLSFFPQHLWLRAAASSWWSWDVMKYPWNCPLVFHHKLHVRQDSTHCPGAEF